MKLTEFIKILQKVEEIADEDLEIRLSSDTEGNSFGTVGETPFSISDGKLYIYPEVDHLEHGE